MKKNKKFKKTGILCIVCLVIALVLVICKSNNIAFFSNEVENIAYESVNTFNLDGRLIADSTDSEDMANNTAILQYAIDELWAEGGGVVYIPAGDYYFSAAVDEEKAEIDYGAERYVIYLRDNVTIQGSGTSGGSATTLYPYDDETTSFSKTNPLDMFLFNEYSFTYGSSITTLESNSDCVGGEWCDELYLDNADFYDFIIDGIYAGGKNYTSGGKGFMANLLKDCDWENIIVKNTDGTGFGVDCTINCTMINCQAINCGKGGYRLNIGTSTSGASGFGIGTGYSNDESILIKDCVSIGNYKYGYFFENQVRFKSDSSDSYPATSSQGFVVENSTAYYNLYDFGGIRANDVTFENCTSKSSSDTDTYTYGSYASYYSVTVSGGSVLGFVENSEPYYFEETDSASRRINLVNMTSNKTFDDVTSDSSYYKYVTWAYNKGVTTGTSKSEFGVDTTATNAQAIVMLWRLSGREGDVVVRSGGSDTYSVTIPSSVSTTQIGAYVWAYDLGLFDVGSFNSSELTLRQLLKWMYIYSSNSEYEDYEKWAVGTNLVSSVTDDTITRAELVKYLYLYEMTSGSNNTYDITYNLLSSDVSFSGITSYIAGSTTTTLSTPTRPGYTFKGWIGSNGSTADTSISITKTTAGDLVYTALWEANSYTVSYNANGGSGTMDSITLTYDTIGLLSSNNYTRDGYIFSSWNTKSDGSGTSYWEGVVVKNLTTSGTITLYAQWVPIDYTITYDANGGSGVPGDQIKVYGTDLTLSSTVPTRTGYTFLGWATSSTATTASYKAGGTLSDDLTTICDEIVTLYAVWSVNTYTISYDANSGNGAPSSQTKTYGTNLTLSTTTPTRTGYSFLGWSTSSTATTATYKAGSTLSTDLSTTNGDIITLYAVWSAYTYTINYDANGGSGAPSSQTKTYGTNLTLSSTIPMRSGYIFLGWSTESTATTVTYTAGSTLSTDLTTTNNATVTLHAVWIEEDSTITYTINYDANGGSGAPSSQTKTYGEDLTLSSTTPTRTGYTFLGWSTSSTATTATYKAGSTLSTDLTTTNNVTVTLYAVWSKEETIISYTISYDANGGSGAPSSQTKTYGTNLTLSSTIPARSGYTFLGWSTSSTATTATYKAGSTLSTDLTTTNNATVTLYAVWSEDETVVTYTIRYNANGGSGAPSSQTKTYGEDLTLSSTIPARSGYTFLGWSTSSTATTATYKAGSTLSTDLSTTNGDIITLYAVWSAYTYTISYDANGGSGVPSSQTKTYGTNLTLSSTIPTRSGYIFLGWSTESTATTVTYTAGSTLSTDLTTTNNAMVTLYAVWSEEDSTITYTINYDANGGNGAPSSQTKTYGEDLTLSSTTPTRTGYTFLGWSSSSSATTAMYEAGSTLSDDLATTNNATVTLYAVWEKNQPSYDIYVNSNNGEVDYAYEDGIIYFTITPTSGYEISSVVVYDDDNNSIEYETASDGTYSFEMPDSNVTISIQYTKDDTSSNEEESIINPQTGYTNYVVVVLGALVIAYVIYRYLKNKNYFKVK